LEEDEKQAAIDRVLERMRKKLERDLKIGPQRYDEIERQAQEIGEELKRTIEEEVTRECGDGYVGNHTVCPCGGRSRFRGRYRKQLISRSGCHVISRAYYYCTSCRKGYFPIDDVLGVTNFECTAGVQALSARFCTYLPFRTAASELEIVCGIKLSATTVARHALSAGNALSEEWAHREDLVNTRKAPRSGYRPHHLQMSMDGAMIFVDGEWREAKLGCCYETGDSGVINASYYATLRNSAVFGRKVRVLAHYSGLDRCSHTSVVADGARWIWQETGKYFPHSTQVLDFYHACEHLWQMANTRYGDGTSQAREWMKTQKEHLLDDKVDVVIKEVKAWKPRIAAKREHSVNSSNTL